MAGKIMTVLGPIEPADAGITLPHEHLFIDLRLPLDEPWRFLLSHDTCTRLQQKAYGGHGLDYVLLEVVPYLQAHGASDQQIEEILVRNPGRLLTFPAILN